MMNNMKLADYIKENYFKTYTKEDLFDFVEKTIIEHFESGNDDCNGFNVEFQSITKPTIMKSSSCHATITILYPIIKGFKEMDVDRWFKEQGFVYTEINYQCGWRIPKC